MILRANPTSDWKKFGDIDPYFGVLTQPEFKSERITDDVKDKFFASGVDHVEKVISVATRLFPDARRDVALDFGCGTGRLAFALAGYFGEVVGLDIAQGMLDEASNEATRRGIDSVHFASSLDRSQFTPDRYDFVHSYIVLQHIPPKIGYGIIADMLTALRPGGIGAIHLTHAEIWDVRFGSLRRLIKDTIPLRIILNIMRGRKWNYPTMQMNRYDLSRVLKLLLSHKIDDIAVHQVHLWEHLGVYLFFRKPEATVSPLWSDPAPRSQVAVETLLRG
jgi:SAM-dependent methyltransferase